MQNGPYQLLLFMAVITGAAIGAKACASESHIRAPAAFPISVSYSSKCVGRRIPVVVGSIRNLTGKRVGVDSGSVPWDLGGLGVKMWLKDQAGNKIPQTVFPTVDPIGPLLLAPFEKMEGTLQLESYFYGTEKAIARGTIFLEWKYVLGPGKNSIGGSLVLRQCPAK